MEAKSASFKSTFEFKFKDGSARNTARIPNATWDEHKELLCCLYRKNTIAEIIDIMETWHSFVVNAGQLGRKLREWGVYKYEHKKRPPVPRLVCPNILEEAPVLDSPDEVTQHPSVEDFPVVDIAVHVSPVAHDGNAPSASTEILKVYEALSTRDGGCVFDRLVTKVIEAYRDAGSLVDLIIHEVSCDVAAGLYRDWKEKYLEESLSSAQWAIARRHRRYEASSQVAYSGGDSKAQEEMTDILRMFHNTVLSGLRRTLLQTTAADYVLWAEVSKDGGVRAIDCLDRLYDRLSLEAADRLSLAAAGWKNNTDGSQEPRFTSQGDSSHSSSAKDIQALAENAAPTVSVSAVPITEINFGNAQLSDIDMDRLSGISVTSSVRSMKSLAMRIKVEQTARRHLDRTSTGDVPSSVMQWDRSSDRGLRLFGQLSSKSSDGSSIVTDASDMSWRPEIPPTIQEDDFANDEAMLAEFGQYGLNPHQSPETRNIRPPRQALAILRSAPNEWVPWIQSSTVAGILGIQMRGGV